MAEAHATRRCPHMERYTSVTPCIVDGCPDAHALLLKVGNQSFMLSAGGQDFYDTKDEAEWARDMLCIALDNMTQSQAQR